MHLSKLAALLATASAVIALNTPSCGSACSLYTQVWAEEFDDALNPDDWWYRLDTKGNSKQIEGNVAVSDGLLKLTCAQVTPSSATDGKSYTGGGIISKQNFQYGYYETSMKMAYGSGWHSSHWLMAGNGTTTVKATAEYNFTEIDTFEVNSSNTSKIRPNVFDWRYGSNPNNIWQGASFAPFDGIDFAAGFHTFGTLWTETTVTFFYNGLKAYSYSYPAKTSPHDYLNTWVSVIAFQDPVDTTTLPSVVEADYLRFYQKDYYITATSLCRSYSQGDTPCPSTVGYSELNGTWAQSSLPGYTLDLYSRYSCSAEPKAQWSQQIGAAGTYVISANNVVLSNSDSTAVFTVTKNGTTVGSPYTMNQSSGPAGWATLTTVTAGQYDVINVLVTGSGKGCTRTDAVKMVRTA